MSSLLVAFCLALGAAVFVFTKVGRRTGHADPKQIYVLSGVAGVIIFVVVLTFFKFIIHMD